ncbi:kinase-like domain-containing protein [Mycena pura]|uniref:Kinase-like domain-containing protein n=1 Tax=Mycena pura TaxID=153505 RepID=A0AAD6YFB5_9AGAR|nr:kinase-like domain-containing protein [Mycena pura]
MLFQEHVKKTLALYQTYPDIYRLWSELKWEEVPGDNNCVILWYGSASNGDELVEPPRFCVRLIAKLPNTLAWKIVHYEADIPPEYYDHNIEIDGDLVRHIPFKEVPNDDDEECIDEDCTDELLALPLIEYDPSIHFSKKARFKAEIKNLLRCGGSTHVVQLLGRTADNQLVFPRYKYDMFIFSLLHSNKITIAFVKKLLLSLIDGLAYLHSQNIIHRDLTARNLLMSGNISSADPAVVIADLQCFAASYSAAPELRIRDGTWDMSTFSFASDIYALGVCLREFILPCHHRSRMMGFDVPAPFKHIYDACRQELPQNRPGLPELRLMALAIEE